MKFWSVGARFYGECPDCCGVVRIDKPVFGSLHLCDSQPSAPSRPVGNVGPLIVLGIFIAVCIICKVTQ